MKKRTENLQGEI